MKKCLWNCQVVLVPYWLLDVIRSHNEQPTVLNDFDKLQHILTKSDLEFYTQRSCDLRRFADGQSIIHSICDSLNPVSASVIDISGHESGERARRLSGSLDSNVNYMSNHASQYVKPSQDGIVDIDNPFILNYFVISDRLSDDPVNGDLLLGVSLSTNTAANKDAAALDNLYGFIGLVAKYYGIDSIMGTDMVSKYMQLKKRSLNGQPLSAQPVTVDE